MDRQQVPEIAVFRRPLQALDGADFLGPGEPDADPFNEFPVAGGTVRDGQGLVELTGLQSDKVGGDAGSRFVRQFFGFHQVCSLIQPKPI